VFNDSKDSPHAKVCFQFLQLLVTAIDTHVLKTGAQRVLIGLRAACLMIMRIMMIIVS